MNTKHVWDACNWLWSLSVLFLFFSFETFSIAAWMHSTSPQFPRTLTECQSPMARRENTFGRSQSEFHKTTTLASTDSTARALNIQDPNRLRSSAMTTIVSRATPARITGEVGTLETDFGTATATKAASVASQQKCRTSRKLSREARATSSKSVYVRTKKPTMKMLVWRRWSFLFVDRTFEA